MAARSLVPGLLVLFLAPAGPLAAQAPDAGASRVARAVIDPYPVRFTRGDSTSVAVSLVDSTGGPVGGVPWALTTAGNQIQSRRVAGDGADRYVLSGDRPATQVFYVTLQAGPDGTPGRVVDSVVVTVADWRVARIEIENPEFAAYSGTTLRLKARVITDHDTEHEHAEVLWRTDDPCFARVMPNGVITFGEPQKITVIARAEGVSAKKTISISSNPIRTLDLSPQSAQTRVGDVVRLRVSAEDRRGVTVENAALSYSVSPVDSGVALLDTAGYFVAEQPGTYLARVTAGDVGAEAVIEVSPRPAAAPIQVTGRGAGRSRATRGLWVFTGRDGRDYAYLGSEDPGAAARVFVWDVTDPARPVLTDSVLTTARMAGDIKVNGDASWAVVSRQPASGGRGGITVLDLSTPAHPTVLAELSDSMEGGIRASWILSPSPVVYAADAVSGAMHIIDLGDPRAPRYLKAWRLKPENAELHDIWSDGKHAYLAQGAEGLVILDVGDDGSPTAPRQVSHFSWKGAAATSAVRGGRYAYVSETIWNCDQCVHGPRGGIRIIDVQKLKEPREVARYVVPEAGAARVWVESGTLYASYHQAGVRLIDVSGELRQDLYRQHRQSGWLPTAGAEGTALRPNAAMTVAAMPFKGRIVAADANSGLWVLTPQRARVSQN